MKDSNFTINGTIWEMGPIKNEASKRDGSPITKQEFVVIGADKYPSKIAFTAMNAKVDDLSYYQIGANITVNFKIEVNPYQGKNYNNLKIVGFGDRSNH